VQQIAVVQIGEGLADMVEFKAQVNGHEATKKANRIQAWRGPLDQQLAPILLLLGSWRSGQPDHEPDFKSALSG